MPTCVLQREEKFSGSRVVGEVLVEGLPVIAHR